MFLNLLLRISTIGLVWAAAVSGQECITEEGWKKYSMGTALDQVKEAIRFRNSHVREMAEQMINIHHQNEERIRSEGYSGLVATRNHRVGSINFHSFSFNGFDVAGLHDHASARMMVGMMENSVVMNGVQFKTQHTDYTLVQPSKTSTAWHATDPIEPPEVPESVSNKTSIEEQVAEMQEYFRAFKDQNETHRNFKDYFKPVLCYIEGAWLADWQSIEESSVGLDPNKKYPGSQWQDIKAQARLSAALGNYWFPSIASLPRKVIGLDEAGFPVYAQWHYRTLCYPFTHDELPPNHLHLVDDLHSRIPKGYSVDDAYLRRGSRFIIDDAATPAPSGKYPTPQLIDRLIGQIPGVDMPGSGARAEKAYAYMPNTMDEHENVLDISHYNRFYYTSRAGDSGVGRTVRGPWDANLFVAMTNRTEVAAVPFEFRTQSGRKLSASDLRYTYLLPLEVIYLSPLTSWNPYDFAYYPGSKGDESYHIVTKTGFGKAVSSPFNGTNDYYYNRIPSEFYTKYRPYTRTQDDVGTLPAYVLLKNGTAIEVAGAGIYTITPPIGNDVGQVRLRYPVPPIHGEGTFISKELNALKVQIAQNIDLLVDKMADNLATNDLMNI